jgi:hypothetical protein
VTLRTGETLKALKVTALDSEKIAGIQTMNLNGRWNDYNKVIMISGVQSIEKRKISAFKTTGLVLILVSSPLWIWALSGSPL